ncbi:probable E3 ubiquitin-protein ligase ZFP1 [Lotus japonicus]|uniref:probable E3 ubiquitin-protein ligase ZFP1 n=1 Tax=Lotus japonicus TaxID=34305 RepID=UPI00258437B5|nr:probable E3 ubiquitin-protein ligase ZFP1 [Lotus japonicus]
MTSFTWQISGVPLDEADIENCQTLEQDYTGDYLVIKVHVNHQPCVTQPEIIHPLVPERSMFLHSHVLIEHGLSHRQMINLFDPILPSELVQIMSSSLITGANILLQNCLPNFYYESPSFRLFKLDLDITVHRLYESELDDDDIIEMIMRDQSMGDVQMVPASNIAIESLKKVKVEESATMERCSICLTEFGDDGTMEVLSMPCKHVYHQDCLVQWLKTSHTCPLCRYTMPTAIMPTS